MPRFPSDAWALAFRSALDANPSYSEAAAAWEGDILLKVIPDDPSAPSEGILLDLWHGTVREARYVRDTASVRSEFVFEGSRTNWARVFARQLDPIAALLDGTFRIRGNLAKAMRFTRAAKELVETAASIPTEL